MEGRKAPRRLNVEFLGFVTQQNSIPKSGNEMRFMLKN
jgi:hypothetical protein